MKKIIIRSFIFFIFLSFGITIGYVQSFEFNTPKDSEGWIAYNAGAINVNTNVQSNGLYIIDPIGPDPWIEINGFSLDASTAKNLIIRMSSNCQDNNSAVYFKTSDSPSFSEDKKINFLVTTGPEWYEYTILMSGNVFWKGIITGLRIDPADYGNPDTEDNTDTFGFDYIRLVSDESGNTGDTSGNKSQIVYNFDPDNGDIDLGYNGNSPWGIPINTLPEYNGYHLPVKEGYISYEDQYDHVDSSISSNNQDPTTGNGYYINTLPPDKGHWYWDGRWNGDLLPNGNGEGWYPGAADHVDKKSLNMPSGNGVKLRIFSPWSGKSVIAVIGENGPAPWTGRQFGASNKVFEGLGLPRSYKGFDGGNPNPDHAPDGNANPADYPVIKYDDNPYWVEVSWADQSLPGGPVTSSSSSATPVPTSTPEPAVNPVITKSAISGTYYIEDERISKAIAWAEKELEVKSYPYNYHCLKFVQDAYDVENGANTDIKRYGYAREAAENVVKNIEGIPPRGAFVFYEWDGDLKGYCTDCGHVGLSIGNGVIIHNSGTSILKQDYKSLKAPTYRYIGWAYPPLTPPINKKYLLAGYLFENDNKDIIGTYDSSNSLFTFGSKKVQFGLTTDIPVIGDWDGNGKDNIGIFRANAGDRSEFHLVIKDWDALPPEVTAEDRKVIPFDGPGSPYLTNIPIAGDWDGDGKDDLGGFKPENNHFYLYKLNFESSKTIYYKEAPDVPFGINGDIPVIGDWDGNGKDEIGIFRQSDPNPNTNSFYLDKGLTGDKHEWGPFEYGDTGDFPVIGNWDGDGDDNIGVFRPSTNQVFKDEKIPLINQGGDFNEDGNIDASDISIFIEKYGSNEGEAKYDSKVDLNGDGVIDIFDITELIKNKIMNMISYTGT